MRQKETGFYQLLRRNIPGFWCRIENVAGVGIPDVLRVYSGLSGLAELKVSIGNYTYFKVSQLAWFMEYHSQGKEVAILIRDEDTIMVVRSTRMIELPRTHTKQKEFKVLTNDLLAASDFMTGKPFHWSVIQAKMEEIHRVSEKINS